MTGSLHGGRLVGHIRKALEGFGKRPQSKHLRRLREPQALPLDRGLHLRRLLGMDRAPD